MAAITKVKASKNGKASTAKKATVTLPKKDRFAKTRLDIPPMHTALYRATLIGDDDLIINAMGPKAKRKLLQSMGPKNTASKVRAAKDPAAEYFDAMYVLNNEYDFKEGSYSNPHMRDQGYTGNIEEDYETIMRPIRYEDCTAIHGVACAGVRQGMVRAAGSCGATMTHTKCNIRVLSSHGNYLPIKFETLVSGEDAVTVGNKQTDLRYRPYYSGWSVDIVIAHQSEIVGPEELTQLLRNAGQFVGLAEWRNERGGQYGMYTVDLNSIQYELLKDNA